MLGQSWKNYKPLIHQACLCLSFLSMCGPNKLEGCWSLGKSNLLEHPSFRIQSLCLYFPLRFFQKPLFPLVFLCSIIFVLCLKPACAHMHTHGHVISLLKRSPGPHPISQKVTFSTDITEAGSAVVRWDEQKSAAK